MATKIYDVKTIKILDGTRLRITPLKIKYLREFMDVFDFVKTAKDDEEAISFLAICAAVCMQQYCPELSDVEKLEDSVDMPTIYTILDIAAGVKIKEDSEKEVKEQANESGSAWEELDLAKLESEAFLLGIWKDYEELESSMSMPELLTTLSFKRELDYEEKKFMAAIQGVDLDKNSKKSSGEQDPWEAMKARVFSGGKTSDPNDIVSFQGSKAAKAGFGINNGLSYKNVGKK
jgi:hypothetical protein